MVWTWPFSQSFQPNNPDLDRDAASAAEPDSSRREDHLWHRQPSQTAPPATVNPRQQEEAWQGEGSGNRLAQQRQVRAEDLPHLLQQFNSAARLRKKQQRMRKKYFNKENEPGRQGTEDLTEQYPCAPSSSGFRRNGGQRGQRRCPLHGPQREQRREARWQRHYWRRNQRRQRTEPLHPDLACGQSSGGQEEGLLWNVKKRCWAKISEVPEEILQEASRRLRPMNMAGYCLPGMCTPRHDSNEDQYTWRNEEESAAVVSGGSSNYNTAAEDFLLVDPLPSTAQEDKLTFTEEEDEESTELAHQD